MDHNGPKTRARNGSDLDRRLLSPIPDVAQLEALHVKWRVGGEPTIAANTVSELREPARSKRSMTATIDQLSTSDIQTDEALRLAALRRYDILDTPPDGSFDRIAAIAADLFSVPIAIVSLVDEDRIWFKSHHGLDVDQVDRSPGLCDSTILRSSPLILPDATADTHALANPLVAGEFGLRFYAGAPLRTHDGFNLGTLCVIDRHPRPVTERQVSQLEALASIVMDQMELRLSARRAFADLSRMVDEKEAALRRTELMAKEIGHRVMNSLQLVSSLLNMQSRGMGSPEAAAQLALASRGVTAIALVHRHIHQSDNVGKASCKGYLERLGADLFSTLRSGESDAIAVISDDVELPTEQIVRHVCSSGQDGAHIRSRRTRNRGGQGRRTSRRSNPRRPQFAATGPPVIHCPHADA